MTRSNVQVKKEDMMGSSRGEEWEREVRAFEESKGGVKGLVDAGIAKVPRIFYQQQQQQQQQHQQQHQHDHQNKTLMSFPSIDLGGGAWDTDPTVRRQMVDQIGRAAESWGFFQVVEHGIPGSVMEEMLNGARRFYDQDAEVKKVLYTRDRSKPFVYNSNYTIYQSPQADWRDTFYCLMAPNPPHPKHVPQPCRDIMFEYSEHVMKVGRLMLELLSEALGLKANHLKDMGIGEGLAVGCHCYPACPEPELTMGTSKHADKYFLTLLLQDQIGGLQVLHNHQWVDVPPLSGALVVNVGDLLQLISNDKFRSVEHRVLANRVGPRFSVPSFFSTKFGPSIKLYGPIKELLSENNPPRYRDITIKEFFAHYDERGIIGTSALTHFKI